MYRVHGQVGYSLVGCVLGYVNISVITTKYHPTKCDKQVEVVGVFGFLLTQTEKKGERLAVTTQTLK